MATVTPRLLSGSTNGRGIFIASATAASGTLLHTSVSGTGVNTFDEVYLYAMNLTTVARKLVLNAGGTTSGDKVRFTVPSSSGGLFLLLPGTRYNGAVTIRGYATSASKALAVHGYVNRSA